MKRKNLWPLILFALAFAIALVVFADALPATAVLQAPDATPGFGRHELPAPPSPASRYDTSAASM